MNSKPTTVTIRHGPEIHVYFDCPYCQQGILVKFRWGPQDFIIKPTEQVKEEAR